MAEKVLILTRVLCVLHFSSFNGKQEVFYNSRKRSYNIKMLIDMLIISIVIESPDACSLIYHEQLKLLVTGKIKEKLK